MVWWPISAKTTNEGGRAVAEKFLWVVSYKSLDEFRARAIKVGATAVAILPITTFKKQSTSSGASPRKSRFSVGDGHRTSKTR